MDSIRRCNAVSLAVSVVLFPSSSDSSSSESSQSGEEAVPESSIVHSASGNVAYLVPPTTFLASSECPVCFGEMTIDTRVRMEHCDHELCTACAKRYMEVKICDGEVKKIQCVIPQCETSFRHDQIQALVNPETYEKYMEFYMIKTHDTYRRCPQCDTAQVCAPPSSLWQFMGWERSRVVCQNSTCRHPFCLEHGDAHKGMSCAMYKRRVNRADALSRKWVKERSKKCPTCKFSIQKIGGCNHMSCSRCGQEFCWLCRSTQLRRHWAPYNVLGCPGLQELPPIPPLARLAVKVGIIPASLLLGPPLAVHFTSIFMTVKMVKGAYKATKSLSGGTLIRTVKSRKR